MQDNYVCAWVPTFQHPSTAYNYVGSVKYVSIFKMLATVWHGPFLSAVLKGNRKLYLSELQLERVVMVADAMSREDFAVFMLVAWGLLARVQSEAVGMQCGQYSDLLTLPFHRHSVIVVETTRSMANGRDILHCRWMRR